MVSVATPKPVSGLVSENEHGRSRVLQVITKLDMGGAEVVALDLVTALHGTIDFAVATVLDVEPTPVGKAMRAQLADLAIPVFPGTLGHYKKGGAIVAAWRLARAVLRFQPDLVHLHTEMPELTWSIAQVLFPWMRRVPVLRTVHNSELWIAWDGIGRWVTNRLASARAVAVSQAAAAADAAIATRFARPLAEVIYNGVRAPSGVLGRTGALAEPASDGSTLCPVKVLFAGRLIAQKGPDLLPAILSKAHAVSARADVTIQIAGTGPLEDALRAALLNVAPRWTMTMTAPIGRLSSRLPEFDVVLMPSRFEGLGILAIETLLAQVPLVATRAPGLIEALPVDYPYGAAVDDVDALGTILAGIIDAPAAARRRVAGFASALASRFAPETMMARYAEIYQEECRGRIR